MNEPDKSLDVLGIKPIGNAVESVTTGVVTGASAFLSRICLPAAEEFGLLLRDRVTTWRAHNAAAIANHAEKLLDPSAKQLPLHAHPRIVAGVIELGSWSDNEEVQQLWAGLLASACTQDGSDDSNLMFVDLLSKMTASQARIFDYICKHSGKTVTPVGWLLATEFPMSLDDLKRVSGLTDLHRIDLELDHLRGLGILQPTGGFNNVLPEAEMSPSALALQMYARCQGSTADPVTFYEIKAPTPPL